MADHPDEPHVDWYAHLGLHRDASAPEIDAAYRRLARALHPDSAEPEAVDVERLQNVLEAHNVLSNPARRREYDTRRDLGRSARRSHVRVSCPVCRGSRAIATPCDLCRGRGYLSPPSSWLAIACRCHACAGAGRRLVPCGACAADGYVTRSNPPSPSSD